MNEARVRLTVDLPRELVQRADAAVAQGSARSRNRLIAHALETYLRQLAEAEADAQFAAMSTDEAYQELALEITAEFAGPDREALELGGGRR